MTPSSTSSYMGLGHMHHRTGEVLTYVCSPENYGIVEPRVYRSNALHPINFPFVKRLGLKTLVYLSPEAPIRAVTQFLEETGTKFIHLGLKGWKPYATWKPISEELIKDALEILLDANRLPVMIMCASGIHQTGTLVGCLRRLQKWNLTSIVEEYRRFAGTKARGVNEQFIELFDEDLITLPKNLPSWFLDQRRMMEEEDEELERLGAVHKPWMQPQVGPPTGVPASTSTVQAHWDGVKVTTSVRTAGGGELQDQGGVPGNSSPASSPSRRMHSLSFSGPYTHKSTRGGAHPQREDKGEAAGAGPRDSNAAGPAGDVGGGAAAEGAGSDALGGRVGDGALSRSVGPEMEATGFPVPGGAAEAAVSTSDSATLEGQTPEAAAGTTCNSKEAIVGDAAALAGTESPSIARPLGVVGRAALAIDQPLPAYIQFYYSRSCPLTTENQSYKRKIIGKID